ncbi:succinylglutamate-semialdehyde dehydrogenase [Legionella maceachernii]|uniref:N-succinylglutamate 5-semialdehyde dehydrogenase n=1 Tax=Legionella maceachernii TaxID=466 RepID=A0A0W0WBV0_9GAMM|nr:succinylglutamate-semialdehyde dehydrogenase [Legionella maceachernii]KTD29831.1 succinylglutamic-5-semialdehyde dehydrogenase [Legionella maceachernii]SJZ78431.1 succinylglutamic semialdehyde dehydrogenase [Legionella maceachernii]SUP02977.1 N-succinylglutamate 5-semialdehyde dehydrogenase [Legionella maceachernii]
MKNNPQNSKTADHYINGQWMNGQGENFISKNPADGSIIWRGNKATIAEIALACEAAHLALPHWSSLEVQTRTHYLQAFAKEVEARRQELAYLIALETGKPLWEAQTEVSAVVSKVNLSIQAYQERNAEKEFALPEANACLRYKPHGVAAVLGAFNFPAHLSNGHIVPALLAGNTVVYKPSELTPAVAQFIMQCWHESGLPKGVLNCIQGDGFCGKALLSFDVQAVYFTGSYKTGKQIHQQFSDKPEVILALEMGGNNPLIIDEVKNSQAAVYLSLLSSMITAGQRCTCARRLFIPNGTAGERFLKQFIKSCQSLRVGKFNDKPEPFMGPVITHEQAQTHLKAQQELTALGGHALLTMSLLAEDTGLLSPGIMDMTSIANVPDEEIFAPFVQIYRYNDFEEALFLANQTRYGLAAGLLSDNLKHYQHFYKHIRAGLINWNRPTTGAVSSLPFGGVGCSGNHRPSAYFAADYCAYPIASLEQSHLTLPEQLLPGINLE